MQYNNSYLTLLITISVIFTHINGSELFEFNNNSHLNHTNTIITLQDMAKEVDGNLPDYIKNNKTNLVIMGINLIVIPYINNNYIYSKAALTPNTVINIIEAAKPTDIIKKKLIEELSKVTEKDNNIPGPTKWLINHRTTQTLVSGIATIVIPHFLKKLSTYYTQESTKNEPIQ